MSEQQKELAAKFVSCIDDGTPNTIVFESIVEALCEITTEIAFTSVSVAQYSRFRDYALQYARDELTQSFAANEIMSKEDFLVRLKEHELSRGEYEGKRENE